MTPEANLSHPLYNPDSGNHPLPDDEREIQSVLRAGTRCLELHPYFVQRYGSRGEAFTRSDGGYLATLVSHSQTHLDEQVLWLGGVLANRGMPRWLMEVHLELLHQELSVAVPERASNYDKLLRSAESLRERRVAWISQLDFDTLVGAFEASCGSGLSNAGGLLVAAVCDERCGLTEAVPSLIAWLGDSHRFSVRWCTAVAETLDRARDRATQSAGSQP